ncbi:MAG: ABC transporter permease subunit [Clostridia bacterium]|nr:ABC transporter permease subunit [Clostridia bacterium]
MKAIFKKELRSYFCSPLGYVFIAVFALVTALFFFIYNLVQGIGDISYVFSNIMLLLVLIIPVLTMRSFAEEKNKKTDQLLLTCPISVGEIVIGKTLAAYVVFALALALTLIYPLIISFYTETAWATVMCNYLGFFLMGAAFISVGIFISSLTENLLISAVASFGALFALYLMDWVSGSVQNPVIAAVANAISVTARYTDFSMGIINISHVIYYLSFIAIFAVLTVTNIEKRRWVK